jgi:hypothetical protein
MAHGRRTTNGQSIHESWYCPELKIIILTIDDGHTRDELVDITRGEPNVTKYMPPAGYTIQKIQLPSTNSRETGWSQGVSLQHLLAVYPLEFEIPMFVVAVD